MKNFKIYLVTAVMALLAAGCTKEVENHIPASDDVVFQASLSEDTKAALKPGATASKVEWVAGDQVGVFAAGNHYQYVADESGATSSLSPVAGSSTADEYYAVYPYDASAVLADGTVTTVLPAVQTAEAGSFSAHLAVAHSTSLSLSFKNVCGLFRVTVAEPEITKVEFMGNAGETVAGKVKVTVADQPSWVPVEGSTTVTLAAAEGETLMETDYYMAVLPQIFDAGVTVTAYYKDGTTKVKEIGDPVTVERNGLIGGSFKAGYWKVETVLGATSGTTADVAGQGLDARLKNPQDIVLASDGSFWITTRGSHGVWRMTTDYTLSKIVNVNDNSLLTNAYLWGADFDSNGLFYIAGKGGISRVYTCDASGNLAEYKINDYTLANTMKVLVDDSDNLYLMVRGSGSGKGAVLKVKDNVVLKTWNLTASNLYEMICFSYDKSKLFVFPQGAGGEIKMIDLTDDSMVTIAGTGTAHTSVATYTDGTPGQPLTATIQQCDGAICAADGTIYFGDIKGTIRTFRPDASGDYSKGTIKTIIGTPYTTVCKDGVAGEATFAYPEGMALAADGKTLFVIDGTTNGTVRKMTFVEE